jgi:hypothetical protein
LFVEPDLHRVHICRAFDGGDRAVAADEHGAQNFAPPLPIDLPVWSSMAETASGAFIDKT